MHFMREVVEWPYLQLMRYIKILFSINFLIIIFYDLTISSIRFSDHVMAFGPDGHEQIDPYCYG
jgi:hypothetical protein